MYTLVYSITEDPSPDTVYINLTNACTNECIFCLRTQKDDICGSPMWHDDKYTIENIIEQFEKFKPTPKQVVFCGYGEPFLRKDMMKKFAEYLRANYPEITIRVNTNGHANAIYKTNVAEEFKDLLDEASVSLNADNATDYNSVCNPKIDNAYDEVKNFITSCVNAGIKTTASVVTGFDDKHNINVEKCEQIAHSLGANFRDREFIKNGY